ncbi:MAG: hypothetical protein ACRELE_09705 [Gemmatimonadales bacterium]
MNVPLRHFRMVAWAALVLVTPMAACVPLGMSLPSDDPPPEPAGGRIKPTVGWLTTERGESITGTPEGSVAIEVIHIGGRALLQQVRRFRIGSAAYGDSILLDRSTLRPVTTFRWTPKGTYVARYNHRVIERVFTPVRGPARRATETFDVEPYSALGMELLVASLPLSGGYHGVLPVAVDTAARGWSWLHFEVQRELSLRERPDQQQKDVRIVDCAIGSDRSRLWIDMEGRSVRRIERLGPDNEVLGTIRRMLLGAPQGFKRAG